MNKTAGNQHLHFTVEIWTSDLNIPSYEKKYKIKDIAYNVLLLLEMNTSRSPKRDLQFGFYRKKVHNLKYTRKVSTHTPFTLYKILLRVLNRLVKLTS